jgi:hypothetical protein
MRKWVVKKTKMRRKKVLNLKKCFFFFVFDQTSLSLRLSIFSILFANLFCLLKNSFLKLSWCRLCEIFFRLVSALSSLIVFCRSFSRSFSTRIRNRNVVKKYQVFNREFFLKCVFDVNRFVCNRYERFNVACMIVKMSRICWWSVDD